MMSQQEYYQTVRAHIDQAGRHLQGVFPTREDPHTPFMYTIGNSEKGLPELLVIGPFGNSIGHVLNFLSDMMIERGSAFEDLERPDIGAPVQVCIVDADDQVKKEYTLQVGRALGIDDSEYRVQQVIVPDDQGRLPWHPGCAAPFRDLPVYRKGGVQ